MSAGKIYLDNTLSSFVAFVYLAVLQVVGSYILYIISYLVSGDFHKIVKSNVADFYKNNGWASINWTMVLEIVIFAILLSLAFYITISFFNFSTRSIIDFLPGMSSRFVVGIVRLVLIVLICWFLVEIIRVVPNDNIFTSQIGNGNDVWYMAKLLIEFLIFDVVFGTINVGLIDKFVEAKQNN